MVYIKSKESLENDFKVLKSLGKIIAASNHPDSINIVYEGGSLLTVSDSGIISVSATYDAIQKDPWLKFQVDLFNNVLVMSDVERFCHQTEEIYTYQANDMTFHKKFKIYFPFLDEWEAEIEII